MASISALVIPAGCFVDDADPSQFDLRCSSPTDCPAGWSCEQVGDVDKCVGPDGTGGGGTGGGGDPEGGGTEDGGSGGLGQMTCLEVVDCALQPGCFGDDVCQQGCYARGTPEARVAVICAVYVCDQFGTPTGACLRGMCANTPPECTGEA